MTDLVAGQVQMMFDPLTSSIEHIRAGKVRPLAVTASMRSEVLPDLPTAGDFVSGYEASSWSGVGAPRNTPVDVVERLNKEITVGLANPNIRARLVGLGTTVFPSSPTEFGKLLADETEKWASVIKFAGIRAQ